jgi:hypothetical protein
VPELEIKTWGGRAGATHREGGSRAVPEGGRGSCWAIRKEVRWGVHASQRT